MYSVYELKANENIEDVAKKFNIEVSELKKLNNDLDNIVEGSLIVVPNKNMYITYLVKSGDNLFNISKKYNIPIETIQLINGLKENEYIYPNQELLIPNGLYYITKENDKLKDILKNVKNIEEFLNMNETIILQPEQIIFYKKD